MRLKSLLRSVDPHVRAGWAEDAHRGVWSRKVMLMT
jgi:hypothetical protein